MAACIKYSVITELGKLKKLKRLQVKLPEEYRQETIVQ